jgi:enoyl-CoA hydratase
MTNISQSTKNSNPDDFILTRVEDGTGRVIVNRPGALNALNTDMCVRISEALLDWSSDDSVDRVLITAVAGRAFCAGGDVAAIIPVFKETPEKGDSSFKAEYTMHSLIHAYPKPVIAIADGLTMGGGCGLLLNAAHPVITDKMDFAMPETAIGFFPDVGASVFLRRPPHHLGVMMGMTGWRIGAGDMIATGIARHAVNSDDAGALADQLIALGDNNGIDDVLGGFKMSDQPSPLMDEKEWIGSHFGKATPQDIRDSLEGDDHPMAEKIRHALDTRSPYSIVISHKLLADDKFKPKDVFDALRLDFIMACRMGRHPDFWEGVRAVLIDKDNAPVWQHDRLDAVEEDLVNAVFAMENRPDLGYPEQQLITQT